MLCINYLSYFHVASPSFNINDTVNSTIDSGRVQYINYPFNVIFGTTIQIHITSGEVVIYISTIVSTPNEAFYDVVIESGGYADVYLSPAVLCNTSQTIYIAIVGGTDSNSSDINIGAGNGDVSTGTCSLLLPITLYYNYRASNDH